MTAEVERQVARALTESFGISAHRITPGALLRDDLGLESIDAVALVHRLEAALGCAVAPERLAALRTVGDVTAALSKGSGAVRLPSAPSSGAGR